MKKTLTIIAASLLFFSCGTPKKPLLPSASGKAGEVMVVIDKELWDGETGEKVREMLAADCPFLPFKAEPLYNLVNVTPGGFAELFQVHRNIVILNVKPGADSACVIFRHDVWARPQCVIQVNASSTEIADSLIDANITKIPAAIEQAERDRFIAGCIQYEQEGIAPVVREHFGGSPHFPVGYSFKKVTDDFIWIAQEKEHSIQGVFVYSYPADDKEPFVLDKLVSHRNEILKANVPGMFENSYMTTAAEFTPMLEFIKFRGRDFAQMRGMWEVENDFMGGPFTSHIFYSEDGKELIVAEAWVYAPKYDKRQMLRQAESIIWSWE